MFTSDAAVNPNDIGIFLVSSGGTFLAGGEAIFNNGPKSLPINLPYWTFLDIFVFDDFALIIEIFVKDLQIFAITLSVGKSLCWKWVPALTLP